MLELLFHHLPAADRHCLLFLTFTLRREAVRTQQRAAETPKRTFSCKPQHVQSGATVAASFTRCFCLGERVASLCFQVRCFRVRWTKCQVHRGTPRLEEHTPAACLQLDFSLGRCQSSISGPIITQAAVIHHLTCVLSGFQCWRVALHTGDQKIMLCSSPCSAVVIGESTWHPAIPPRTRLKPSILNTDVCCLSAHCMHFLAVHLLKFLPSSTDMCRAQT